MKKNSLNPSLDSMINDHAASVWRLCLLMVRSEKDAEELAFQSFLRLAARTEKETRTDRVLLYASAVTLCQDWYARKLRKPPRRDALLALFSCRPEDPLASLVCGPLPPRTAAGLRLAGLSGEEIQAAAGRRACENASRIPEDVLEALRHIAPPEDFADQLSDRVLDRFSERSVGFENAIHRLKSRFDRAVPWLALLVLLFFGFCIWFVQR